MDEIDEIREKVKDGRDLSNEDAQILLDELDISHHSNLEYAKTIGYIRGKIQAIISDVEGRRLV